MLAYNIAGCSCVFGKLRVQFDKLGTDSKRDARRQTCEALSNGIVDEASLEVQKTALAGTWMVAVSQTQRRCASASCVCLLDCVFAYGISELGVSSKRESLKPFY